MARRRDDFHFAYFRTRYTCAEFWRNRHHTTSLSWHLWDPLSLSISNPFCITRILHKPRTVLVVGLGGGALRSTDSCAYWARRAGHSLGPGYMSAIQVVRAQEMIYIFGGCQPLGRWCRSDTVDLHGPEGASCKTWTKSCFIEISSQLQIPISLFWTLRVHC